ncbi:hypothetical protein S83_011298 [Arachis hypogaea]
MSLQMARSSQKDRKKMDVSVQHECPLNLLPRKIWSRITTMVASNSIENLFNMQATCKVFLVAASSDAVYKHATMSYKLLVYFFIYLDVCGTEPPNGSILKSKMLQGHLQIRLPSL